MVRLTVRPLSRRRYLRFLSQQEYEDADIVFSSHADTLQIAQCCIAGADERLFSQVRTRLCEDEDSAVAGRGKKAAGGTKHIFLGSVFFIYSVLHHI